MQISQKRRCFNKKTCQFVIYIIQFDGVGSYNNQVKVSYIENSIHSFRVTYTFAYILLSLFAYSSLTILLRSHLMSTHTHQYYIRGYFNKYEQLFKRISNVIWLSRYLTYQR